jgi:plasmid stability protein
MTRTQLQLDDDTYDALRRRAYEQRKSLSAVARDILRSGLGLAEGRGDQKQSFAFFASGRSGRSDISVRHDEALGEDFK